ncbi:MAG TPA: tetratricopeptide repeat-containing glycosyltransferase family protein [Pirellulales bacterium]|nr:tetratricopeptide repeat-containing glycosyltransferase family protein [Pirellulales bacterium]
MPTDHDQGNEAALDRYRLHAGTSVSLFSHGGTELRSEHQIRDAVLAWQQAVRLRPDWAEGHHILSVALRLQGRLDEALLHCREAVRWAPDMAEAHNNLGSLLEETGRVDESIASLNEALRLNPNFAQAHSNLGIALYRQHRYRQAAAAYRRAIALEPTMAEAHNNLASVLHDLGHGEAALRRFAEAIRLKPYYRQPHWGRALIWLSRGEFERGWPEFEWRLSPAEMRHCRQPRWDGSDLSGRTILLDAEQGLGDTLQFVRYGSLLRRRGANVLLACQPRLVRLLAGCPAIDRVVSKDESVPPFDVHCPLLSLPGIFGTTLANVPAGTPYLSADPSLVECWRRELSRLPGFKIGVAWQGSAYHPGDRRSIPLAEFAPLAQVPGVTLVSLQKGTGGDQLAEARRLFPIVDFDELDEGAGPFMDTAALAQGLDLVVSCDSAICHLAGAMGRPVWAAIAAAPDWRWLVEREDSPWYPTLRLFRQAEPGRWSDVFLRIAAAVTARIAALSGSL